MNRCIEEGHDDRIRKQKTEFKYYFCLGKYFLILKMLKYYFNIKKIF